MAKKKTAVAVTSVMMIRPTPFAECRTCLNRCYADGEEPPVGCLVSPKAWAERADRFVEAQQMEADIESALRGDK